MECGYRNWRSSTQTVSQRHLADIITGNFFFLVGFPKNWAPSEESGKGRSNLTDEDGCGWLQRPLANNRSMSSLDGINVGVRHNVTAPYVFTFSFNSVWLLTVL